MRTTPFCLACLVLSLVAGCGQKSKSDPDFYTSGSREADQRAEQRMARDRQLKGGDSARKASDTEKPSDIKPSLFRRLGGTDGITGIVDDYLPRLLADPRVNFERRGITYTSTWRHHSAEWKNTPEALARIKTHMVQFLSLATGGPSVYEGQNLGEMYRNKRITNAEFDAAIGDLKATLDRLAIPTDEQKELLAIVESTRPQIVTQR